MKKRIIAISLILLLFLSLTSCSSEKDMDELKRRFEDHTPDNNVVVIWDDSILHFADHTIRLDDLAGGEKAYDGCLLADGQLYFSSSTKNTASNFSLYVYTCDTNGNNQQLVFEKHGYKTNPWATGNGEVLYIEHFTTNSFDASSRVIDSYNVVTGAYQTVATGKDAKLSNYRRRQCGRYSCTYEGDVCTVTDPQNNTTYTIDSIALVRSTFSTELDGHDHLRFEGFFAADNGKMFLLYNLGSSLPYPFLVCEYLPDRGEIVYKSLISVPDYLSFQVLYV